jgi:ferritin-like protein
MLSVLALVWTGQVHVWSSPPPDGELDLPREVTITGSVWEDVRENQEIFAREFDALLERLDPVIAQRCANYTEETNQSLGTDLRAADLEGDVPMAEVERRTSELLTKHPDPYEQAQIKFVRAQNLGLWIQGKEAREKLAYEAIEEALKLPLWPEQRVELHRVKGQIIMRQYRRQLGEAEWGEDAAYREMRRNLATEYLKGVRVALDCAFPQNLPDLHGSNTLEKYQVPDDPVKHQAILDAIAYRKTIQAKAMKFLGILCATETMRVEMAERVAFEYGQAPQNAKEVTSLAAEILHDPQEEAKLMEMLKVKAGEQSTP